MLIQLDKIKYNKLIKNKIIQIDIELKEFQCGKMYFCEYSYIYNNHTFENTIKGSTEHDARNNAIFCVILTIMNELLLTNNKNPVILKNKYLDLQHILLNRNDDYDLIKQIEKEIGNVYLYNLKY